MNRSSLSRSLFTFAVSLATVSLSQSPPKAAPVAVPQLAKAPRIDGNLKDVSRGTPLKGESGSARFTAKVGFAKSTLYLGVDVTDDRLAQGDQIELTVFFPNAGATAQGYTYRLAADGRRASTDAVTPPFAQEQVTVATRQNDAGWTAEIALPARALPRIPAREPLLLELCVNYEDADGERAPVTASNCVDGMMERPLRVADDFRRALRLKPPESVEGLEARPNGWIGYAVLHYPAWAQGDQKLDVASLRALLLDRPIEPGSVNLGVPDELTLKGAPPLYSVVSGRNPFVGEDRCDAEHELRLAIYAVKGNVAERTLEWPAASCALGRATSIDLDEEGTLTIGYSNGASVTFIWSKDHFERTEIGIR